MTASITPSPEMVERASEAMWREEATGIPALERARLREQFSELHPAAQAKYRRVATACLTAALSCPDGFRLVPVEPTDEMYIAVTADLRGPDHMPGSFDLTDAGWARRFWKSMLAASPAPAPQPISQDQDRG